MSYVLRDYQQKASDAAVSFFNNKIKKTNAIMVLPTGSGKSLIIADIAARLDGHTLVFQPSKEILEQNFKKLCSYGILDCSIYSASFNSKEISRITFATIGSVKVTGRITNDQYVKVTAETTTNFCLVNDSDSSARISYRPEDIFASAVNGSAPIFRGRDFSAKEVNGNGGSCLVVARISDYAWEHAAAGTYSDTITFTASLETANAAG